MLLLKFYCYWFNFDFDLNSEEIWSPTVEKNSEDEKNNSENRSMNSKAIEYRLICVCEVLKYNKIFA